MEDRAAMGTQKNTFTMQLEALRSFFGTSINSIWVTGPSGCSVDSFPAFNVVSVDFSFPLFPWLHISRNSSSFNEPIQWVWGRTAPTLAAPVTVQLCSTGVWRQKIWILIFKWAPSLRETNFEQFAIRAACSIISLTNSEKICYHY